MKFSPITVIAKQTGIKGCEPLVSYEGKTILCDGRLRGDLARLVPMAWGTAPEKAWRPFVYRAVVLGIL